MISGSFISSFFAASASVPADVMKSRMQNMPMVDGKPMYNGIVDCLTKTIKAEGVLALWKGFMPAFIKLTPHTVISFVILEKLTSIMTGSSAL